MSNYYLAKVKGISVDGVYTNFATPIPIDDAFPYPHVNYANGLNKAFTNVVLRDCKWIVGVVSPTENSYTFLCESTEKEIDFIRLILNDNQTIEDIAVTQQNCASGGNIVDRVYESSVAVGSTQTMADGAYNGYLLNANYGARFVGLPIGTICKTIQINPDGGAPSNGTKYDIDLPIENAGQIQSYLNGLGLGVYSVVNQNDADGIFFDIYKTSRDEKYPQAVSITYTDEETDQEVEIVRAFELLDSVVDSITVVPIYQREEDNCITEEERDLALKMAENVCPDCC